MSEKPPESSVMGISTNGGVSMDIPLKYKRRKVSAIRDFPKGCGRFAPLVNAKPSEDHPGAVGSAENVSVIRDFPVGCGTLAPLVNGKPSEDRPVVVGGTENLRVGEVGEEGFILGEAKGEKTLVMEAMDDGQTCKPLETVKPVTVSSLNTQEPEGVDLGKNSSKIEIRDSIKDPDGLDMVNNATQPEAKDMQRSTMDAVMPEATSSISEPPTLIPVVGNVDKKYPPRRRISAFRDFPPGCGINAPKLSKGEHRNGTDSSKKETLENEKYALGTKQSEQVLKGDTRKTREDVHDEDTYKSNLREEGAIKESAALENKCLGSQNSSEERKTEKMVKGDAGKIREEFNNGDTLKCILKGDGIKEFLDSTLEKSGQDLMEAAVATDHVEAAFHGKLEKGNMRESSVKQTPKSISRSNSKTPSVSKRTDMEPPVAKRIDKETASSGGKSGRETVELSKHDSFRRTSAGNLEEESQSVNSSQGEESAGLGPSGDRVIVQALMAAPNCPWRQGKRGFKSPPSRGPSGGKGKKHDMHESSKPPSKKKKGPGNSEEKPTKKTMPHTGNDSKQCADIQLVLVDENESPRHDKKGNTGPSGSSSKKSDMHENSTILSRKKNRRGNSEETSTGTPHTEKNSNRCYDNRLVLVDEHDVIVLDDEAEDENLRLIGDKEEKDDVHVSDKRDGQDEYDSPGDDEEDENFALVPRSQARSMSLIPFGLHEFDDKDDDTEAAATRNKVRETLRLFQGIFRKLLRDEEAKSKEKGNNSKRVDLISAKILKEKNKWVNTGKQILGLVPGVEVGDEFHFRVELAIVGLHRPFQGGIDYLKKGNRILATSIVASGGHNEMDSSDVLIYSGQGGNPVNGKQAEDQKLERGNLALKNSMDESSAVRVIRGFKETKGPDSVDAKGKVVATYIYDGLYLVERYWQEIGRHGTNVFMFRLRRIPGQPELALKEVKKLKKYRVGICVDDISQGTEKLPICAVNTIDHEKPPSFKYITSMIYPSWYNPSPPKGCGCTNGCSDSEKCLCAVKNGGEIPFNHSGAIVEAKPLVYECGPSCKCPPSCHNRVSQHGIKFQLEIFKTESRGWGVRSLTSIPSGSFICEYTGELLEDTEAEKRTGSDEYLFDIGSNYNDRTLWDGLSKLMPPDLQSSLSCETVDDVGFTIDALECGSVGRFINHSCSPNLYAQNVLYDHDDKRMPHIMLFAAENIPPLQELTYHYNYVVDQVRYSNGDIKKKECFCGSHECSGRLY